MFIDLNEIDESLSLKADVCVVGCGIASLALASEFRDSRQSVLCLESGGDSGDNGANALNEGNIVGLPYYSLTSGRTRGFGGTSELWGGQCARLNRLDFMPRPWVPHSGWPISADILEQYYPRAAKFFGMDPDVLSFDQTENLPIREMGVDESKLHPEFSVFSPYRFVGRRVRDVFSASRNVDVLLNATATELLQGESGGSISAINVRNIHGKRACVRAKVFVLACGAIENARLLLASRRVEQCGIGNGSDQVGRYLQDHVIGTGASIAARNGRALWRQTDVVRRDAGVRYSQKLRLSDEYQREAKVLNATVSVVYDDINEVMEPLARVYRALRRRSLAEARLRDYWSVASHPFSALRAVARNLGYATPAAALHGIARLSCISEQAPNPESRVSLSDELDVLGVPKVKVNWKLTDLERKTFACIVDVVASEFQRLGLGYTKRSEWLSKSDAGWTESCRDILHTAGTTRMADGKERGVVDQDCRVFGVDNLFVAGSSVFPTSGHANPVFAFTSLALRLGDHIKADLR